MKRESHPETDLAEGPGDRPFGEVLSPDSRRLPMRLAICALLAASFASAAAADDAFFRGCEVQRRVALVDADAAAIAALMLDGAQYVHSNGEVDDEKSLIRRLASGELRYRGIFVDAESYACHATGCEVTGTQTLDVSAQGRDLSLRNRFRATWLRAGDACQLVSYESSPAGPKS
jgi:hypothetical protein